MPHQTHDNIPADAWRVLRQQLTEERQEKMVRAADMRTNHIRLVVQDIHDPHNISACIRSAEAFGILNIDVVNLKQKFHPSTVARGVHHWLKVRPHESIEACVDQLKKQGYVLAAGMPSQNSVKLDDLPVDKPIALLFGNEHEGVAPDWGPHVDYEFTIPMVGLVESLNISVSAAISLYTISQKAKRELAEDRLYLSTAEKEQLLSEWTCRHVKNWPEQLRRLRSSATSSES